MITAVSPCFKRFTKKMIMAACFSETLCIPRGFGRQSKKLAASLLEASAAMSKQLNYALLPPNLSHEA